VKRQLILAGILLVSLAMAMSPSVLGVTYTSSQRGMITAVTGSYLVHSYVIPGATSYDLNTTLPWAIADFDHTLTEIHFAATGAVNLTGGYWNERVFPWHHYVNGNTFDETITVAISNGLNPNDRYSHIYLTANNTAWSATVSYYLYDVADINSAIVYTEIDNAVPRVDGTWSVTDNATFTVPFASMLAYMTIGYPSTAAGTTDPNPWAPGTSVTTGSALSDTYQKYGPAHSLSSDDIVATTNKVSVSFTAKDVLTKAIWDITPTNSIWNGAFGTLNTATFVAKINDHTIPSSDITFASIHIKNVNIAKGDNVANFTWTAAGGGGTTTPPTTTTPNVLTQEAIAGVPNWALGAIFIIIVIAGYAIWKNEKKPKK